MECNDRWNLDGNPVQPDAAEPPYLLSGPDLHGDKESFYINEE